MPALLVLLAPFAAVIVYGAVGLVRDSLASPKIPRPTTSRREPSRLTRWAAGRIKTVEFDRTAA
jgi:hypothetical protein